MLAAIAQHYDLLAEDVSETHGRPSQWLVAFLHLYEDAKKDPERAQLSRGSYSITLLRASTPTAGRSRAVSKAFADAVGQLPGAASPERRRPSLRSTPCWARFNGVLSQPTLTILPWEFRAFNLSQERALEAILSRALEPLTLPVPKATEPAIPATMRTFPDKP